MRYKLQIRAGRKERKVKQSDVASSRRPQGQEVDMQPKDGCQTAEEWEAAAKERKEIAEAKQEARSAMGFGENVYFSDRSEYFVTDESYKEKEEIIYKRYLTWPLNRCYEELEGELKADSPRAFFVAGLKRAIAQKEQEQEI